MHVPLVPHASVKAFTASVVGPVNVELAGVVKSTWNFRAAGVWGAARGEGSGLGPPAGGGVALSRSDASRLDTLVGALNDTIVAAWPASICERFRAATLVPRNVVPAALNW